MKVLFFIIASALSINALAQDDKAINIIVNGQGKTQEEAKLNALRSAIEQAFGTFISSETEILNDDLLKDEIVSVSNGNIQKFEIISEIQLPNEIFLTSINATVSLTKLSSFIESKGYELEFQGGLFSLNAKKEEFYSRSELTTLNNFINTRINSIIYYDYTLFSEDPFIEGENYAINLEVGIKPNNNMHIFFDDLFNLLSFISLDSSTIDFRIKSNLEVYIISDPFMEKKFYLRNKESFDLLQNLDRKFYLKVGDFDLITNPEIKEFKLPITSDFIKLHVTANNFILLNRRKSPNPGVYWEWLPYVYNDTFVPLDDGYRKDYSTPNDRELEMTSHFLKKITNQSDINKYYDLMGNALNNNSEFLLVLNKKIIIQPDIINKISSFQIKPILNNYQ